MLWIITLRCKNCKYFTYGICFHKLSWFLWYPKNIYKIEHVSCFYALSETNNNLIFIK